MRPQTLEEKEHKTREQVEKNAIEREPPESGYSLLAKALIELIVAKGIVSAEQLTKRTEATDAAAQSNVGCRIVAEAWTNASFHDALLANANKALAKLGIFADANLVAVENTDDVHNVVVCTLCSCYPRFLLGLPPDWYKSFAYRARVVKEPRAVIAEFGLELADDVRVQVHDSNADLRYIVVPKRPTGTDGWSHAQLEKLVTRDCLIGVAVPSVERSRI